MRGTITAFTTTAGFGTVQLEDGSELPFDFSACENSPIDRELVGLVAEDVIAAVGRTGGRRAVRVVFASPKKWPLHAALKLLRSAGLISRWTSTAAVKKAFVEQLDEEAPATIRKHAVDLLDPYYAEPGISARASEDLVLRHDWRFGQETADLPQELASLLGLDGSRQISSDANGIVVEGISGNRAIASNAAVEGLIDFFEDELVAHQRDERLLLLGTDSDFWLLVVADPGRLLTMQSLRTQGILDFKLPTKRAAPVQQDR